ncbi:MAG: nicotinamide-nucleotide amidohydrolase family protein [Chloroflexi bacterium]|nr:nicotinamide-nucleotide amidohydrolase family protein [Chloroflexota bacterium]
MAGRALREAAAGLQEICLAGGLTVATAESCTGGLVADAITDNPGSSAYFRGGLVAYADAAKAALLDVPATILAEHGAVSSQVARAMAEGARRRFGTDLAVAVTGIAGPGGATPAKPVGLVYLAVAGPDGTRVERRDLPGRRRANKAASAAAALELLQAAAVHVTTASSASTSCPSTTSVSFRTRSTRCGARSGRGSISRVRWPRSPSRRTSC